MGNPYYIAQISNLTLLLGTFSHGSLGLKITLDDWKGHKKRTVTV